MGDVAATAATAETEAAATPKLRAVTRLGRRTHPFTALLLPIATSVAVLALTVLSGRDASPTEWARSAGLVLLGLLAYGLIARADPARPGHASATLVLPAAVVLLPLDLALSVALVLAVPRLLFAPHMLARARALEAGTEVAATLASALAAAAVYLLAGRLTSREGAWALAALTACVAFVAVSHALRLATDREEGGRSIVALGAPTELLLATLGAALAAVCLTTPWLVPFALAPLLLLPRWFEIPMLEQQARRDPKTGLFNARHFELTLVHELEKAAIPRTPLSVLLADLDLLRTINNTHGHLAGDTVLRGVADILRAEVRTGDIPARFGGEEFAVLLPGTGTAEAIEIAERLRRTVADARFAAGTADVEIRVTVSIGVASYPEDGSSAVRLIHRADVAVYRAKLQGRNRVVSTKSEHHVSSAASTAVGLRAVTDPRRDVPAAELRRKTKVPAILALAERRLPLAAALVGATFASLPLLLLNRASLVTAVAAICTCVAAVFVLRKAARAKADRESAVLAHERAERLRQGADSLSAVNRSLESANRLLRERSSAAMETLSAAVDARDSHMTGHSRRVHTLALSLGRELGLSESELEVLGQAARFHDVGKLAIPESILLKSGALGDLDWDLVRRHPEEGARLIDHLGFLEDALPAIRHHHERFDGTGYPDGLAGEDIPLGGRIIHLADALDAMLTARPYRPELDPLEAIGRVRDGSGTQFCPRCVDALDRLMLAELKRGADVPRELLAS
jgi:diguanylate cyclase (GGDEF)-like protein